MGFQSAGCSSFFPEEYYPLGFLTLLAEGKYTKEFQKLPWKRRLGSTARAAMQCLRRVRHHYSAAARGERAGTCGLQDREAETWGRIPRASRRSVVTVLPRRVYEDLSS